MGSSVRRSRKPFRARGTPPPQLPVSTFAPQLLLLWRDPEDRILHLVRKWNPDLPASSPVLKSFMDNYAVPPVPHCARILSNGRILAEWIQASSKAKPSAESPVTAKDTCTSGDPSTPLLSHTGTQDDNPKPSARLRPVYPQESAPNDAHTTADNGVMSGPGRSVA